MAKNVTNNNTRLGRFLIARGVIRVIGPEMIDFEDFLKTSKLASAIDLQYTWGGSNSPLGDGVKQRTSRKARNLRRIRQPGVALLVHLIFSGDELISNSILHRAIWSPSPRAVNVARAAARQFERIACEVSLLAGLPKRNAAPESRPVRTLQLGTSKNPELKMWLQHPVILATGALTKSKLLSALDYMPDEQQGCLYNEIETFFS